ncbi:DNA-binding transcriptional response regulator, NtrC family, contains REC, AAA-type ATPase, and a Fis-type DNA-binding domains [Granulicella rosea]|uniref:DNA-binding transcriptional response regulator, NtrC family, contains REC, AAA-type ATPase, and a Fis-type DNA-binding domains n=1 Tax=Granulicella rosea TaxID=474952 RepID=A0A239EJG1_9BACT|nr:sigma-54 dependent transcriptional regulator [Granulicella rosea]SNS44767.1 DNA-binding transcriptional response regulator, NtrC family, contains REC, AAA-type ATPase, and a Fis-type DNA-binding domains [Granulicella rosea]
MSGISGQRGAEPQVAVRSVILASPDAGLRQRLSESLTMLRWTVGEATGGADAMAQVERLRPEALIVDNWLPDLEAGEFTGHMREMYPAMDLLRMDGSLAGSGARSPRRNELLHALREAQDGGPALPAAAAEPVREVEEPVYAPVSVTEQALPEMIGQCASMRELARMIRLVAPRSATVLIEGETGTGKEVVAKAVHRLSGRSGKPFAVLNCAAIPEALLEAELFGHTRGAFTGAVQSRTGRIEAANGGTLFLDEIGEMPLALQAKMLRFLECGELQRVGDNETMRVDVRVIAATHQPLEQRAGERLFRLDLYHRLAVFPLEVPALRERMSDLGLLVDFFLERMGREMPRKRISAGALAKLGGYRWPGNVRELMHVLERASILVEDRPEIGVDEIRFGAHMAA